METEVNFFKQYRYHLIGGAVVLATITGIVIWQLRKNKKSQPAFWTPPPQTPTQPAPRTQWCQSHDYPLRLKNCHPDVKLLQKALKALGADLGRFGPNRDGVDGKFGEKTLAALRAKFGKESVSKAEMDRIKAGLKQWGAG